MDIHSLGEAGAATAGAAPPQPQVSPQTQAGAPSTDSVGTPASSGQGSSSGNTTLAHTVGGLLGGTSSDPVHVSYRIEKPDEIVTVFTDAQGHEIAQVPSEAMIQIAQFFDTQTGVAIDRNA